MLVLIGKTGSGKTTTAKLLEAEGFERSVTDTTRPMRPGEKDGVDYNFVTEEDFLKNLDHYAEYRVYHTIFGDWYYGSRKALFKEHGKRVIILDPRGYRTVSEKGVPCTAIYLRIQDDTVLKRLASRGDDMEEARRRLETDRKEFEGLEGVSVLDVDLLSEKEVIEEIKKIVT